MYNPLQNAAIFLLNTALGIYITLVLLRLLLQILRADFYNPICQFIVKITNPVLVPLRKFIPGLFGIDFAAVILLFLLQFILLSGLHFIISGSMFNLSIGVFSGLVILAFGKLLSLTLSVFTFSIFIYVIISWFPSATQNPIFPLIYTLCYPILAPIKRKITPVAGLDLSPLIALILLQLTKYIIIEPIMHLAGKVMLY